MVMRLMKLARHHALGIEITKFTLVGGANFVLTFLIFTGALKFLHLHYLLSLGLAWLFGNIFSYVVNFVWVFKPEKKIAFNTRLIKFMLTGLCSLGLNMFGLDYLVRVTQWDPFYAQVILMPLVVVFNFLAAKYWSLRARKIER